MPPFETATPVRTVRKAFIKPAGAPARGHWQQVLTSYHRAVVVPELQKRDARIDKLELRLRALEGRQV